MVWYCNRCNDIMNNQSGWDPFFHGKYKCKHCGAIIDLSDPDDYDYEDEDGVIHFGNDPDEIIDELEKKLNSKNSTKGLAYIPVYDIYVKKLL